MSEGRYARQVLLAGVGVEGQRRLAASTALVVGCGALGSCICELLVRAGVGRLRVADRDLVELSNLQRQFLFDEADAAAGLPKAEAAVARLRRINSEVELQPRVVDVTPRSVGRLLEGVDLVLDGTDNFETRYLMNDACIERGIPWVHGGAVGTDGLVLPVRPEGPCLRCLFPDPPPPASLPRCDTHGVLGPLTATVASLQATFGLRFLLGTPPDPIFLLHLDLWEGRFGRVELKASPDCPACGQHRFDFLERRETAEWSALCGRDAVQLTPAREFELDLDALAASLPSSHRLPGLLRFAAEGLELSIFADGRALVRGTSDLARARSVHARWVGQ
jgi:adenylyltransferase/sulfurtransferase